MSSSDKQLYSNQLLTQYLLGALPEEETERLDELSIADDELAVRLSEVENDLVDAYVRGELSGQTLEQFKSFYLLSPKRREKVRFAETLLVFEERAVSAQEKDAQVPVPASSEPSKDSTQRFSWRRFFPVPRVVWQWGFAAAAMLTLVAGSYLLFENLRLRNQMTQAQAERAGLQQREQALQGQLAQQRSDAAETVKELAEVRHRLAQLEQQVTADQPGGKTARPARALHIISFSLLPLTRGAGQIPVIDVPAQTDYVRLQLPLEFDDFPEYQVALTNPANNEVVWRSGRLKTRPIGKGKAISLDLPARLLRPQNYNLEASGISRSGAAEFVSSYPFRVVMQ